MRLFVLMALLTSCGTLPQLYKSVEDIADNDAIDVMVSKDAFENKKNVIVLITVQDPQKTK